LTAIFLNAGRELVGCDGVHQGFWWTPSLEDRSGRLGRDADRVSAAGKSERPRRSWSADEKRRIVQETSEPGSSVATVAQRHGLNANLLFKWRRTASLGVATAGTMMVSAVGRDRPLGPASEQSEFLPIGVFGRAEDEGPAVLVTAPSADGQVSHRAPAAQRSSLDGRPGVIEVDLPDGARIRVDAFVSEKAFRRVLSVLKSLA